MNEQNTTQASADASTRHAHDTFAVVPRPPSGVISAEQLETLAQTIRRYGIPFARITSGQRIALVGIKPQDLPAVRAALGIAAEEADHGGPSVQACPGATGCPNGLQDTQSLATRLDGLLAGQHNGTDLPARVRVGVSGCPRCCGESYVRDIGLVGRKNGWTVIFGGNAGGKPRVGDELASGLATEEALDLVARALAHYAATAKKRQRTARYVEACGIESLREALGLAPQSAPEA
ncbi:NAD(P)/FAD-dependent oxidoreductase [Humidesulfovibrio idahonensis]